MTSEQSAAIMDACQEVRRRCAHDLMAIASSRRRAPLKEQIIEAVNAAMQALISPVINSLPENERRNGLTAAIADLLMLEMTQLFRSKVEDAQRREWLLRQVDDPQEEP